MGTAVNHVGQYYVVTGVDSIIYLLTLDNELIIKNKYKDSWVTIGNETYFLGKNNQLNFSKSSTVNINATGYEYYSFSIDTDKRVDFQTVFRAE